MKILLTIMCLLCYPGLVGAAGQSTQSIVYDGSTRSFRVFLPESLEPGRQPALLLVLHGLRGSGERISGLTGFNEREVLTPVDASDPAWSPSSTR